MAASSVDGVRATAVADPPVSPSPPSPPSSASSPPSSPWRKDPPPPPPQPALPPPPPPPQPQPASLSLEYPSPPAPPPSGSRPMEDPPLPQPPPTLPRPPPPPEPSSMTDAQVQRVESRAKWANSAEFILSCIGFSVGLGNVWRFPYLCYKHGGATFVAVYLFLQLGVGKPLYFMELAVSQYAGKGPVRVWDLNPAARGVGLAMCLVSVNISLYYNVIMTYVLYYFFASLNPTLPWATCQPDWVSCFTERINLKPTNKCPSPTNTTTAPNTTTTITTTVTTTTTTPPSTCWCTGNQTIDRFYPGCLKRLHHASSFFFEREVTQQSDNLSHFGRPSWKLALLLLLSWIIVVACMIKGIRTSGKVVYFTATFPYVILLILLGRGASLDGAVDGIQFFIVPDWSAITRLQLWIDAAGQMFFSLGLSLGGIMMFGSYNPFHHPIYKDAVIISTMDLVTSVMSGLVIFATFGNMAKQTGKSILDVAQSRFGLAFVAYPEVLNTLALPNLWSFLFFFMLYILGLDSQFALLETATTYLIDDFKWCRHHKTLLRLAFAAALYFIGLALVAPGGFYVINIIDVYGASYAASTISLLETVSIMWVYGIRRFVEDVEYMLGRKPCLLPYWYFVWVFWSPVFLTLLLCFVVGLSETPSYRDGTPYGPAVLALCWLVYVYTLVPVPLWFGLHVRSVWRQHGFLSSRQFLKAVFKPNERWGPADGTHDAARTRTISVWADVLDWKLLH